MEQPEPFLVSLPAFSGTLGELAQALRSRALKPEQLDVLALVRGYLAYFARISRNDLDLASEALPLVARIVELKVRFLLPGANAPEEEVRLEEALEAISLLAELEEAIAFLRARRSERRVVLAARAPRPEYPRPERPLKVGVERLRQLAERYRGGAYFELAVERFTMAGAMAGLLARLAERGRGTLLELAEHQSWSVLGVTFAGMLELCKEGKLRASQAEPFGPIELERARQERIEAA